MNTYMYVMSCVFIVLYTMTGNREHKSHPVTFLLRFKRSLSSWQRNATVISDRWRKACAWHFYWTATSTRSGVGGVKWAKFESFSIM